MWHLAALLALLRVDSGPVAGLPYFPWPLIPTRDGCILTIPSLRVQHLILSISYLIPGPWDWSWMRALARCPIHFVRESYIDGHGDLAEARSHLISAPRTPLISLLPREALSRYTRVTPWRVASFPVSPSQPCQSAKAPCKPTFSRRRRRVPPRVPHFL